MLLLKSSWFENPVHVREPTTDLSISFVREVSSFSAWDNIEEPDVDFEEFVDLFSKTTVKEKKQPLSDTITKSKAKQVCTLETSPQMMLGPPAQRVSNRNLFSSEDQKPTQQKHSQKHKEGLMAS